MKNTQKTIIIMFVALLAVSCSKEERLKESFKTIQISSQFNKNNGLKKESISGVKNYRDMLHFNDLVSYKNAKILLNDMQVKEINYFNSLHLNIDELSTLNEKELDEISDKLEIISNEIGFSETGIYSQFENRLNFNSLRKVISTKEEIFLNSPNPNWEQDPDNHFIVLNEERALLNEEAEIKIGNSIYKFTEDFVYEITDGNYETLIEIRNGGYNVNMTNVKINGIQDQASRSSSKCRQTRSKSGFKIYGSKRIKWVIKINSWWTNNAVSITTNYKKKGNKWVKYRTYTKSSLQGRSCQSGYYNVSAYSHAYSKSVTHKRNVVNESFQNGYLQGFHFGAGSTSYISTLTW